MARERDTSNRGSNVDRNEDRPQAKDSGEGDMTVREAGRLGGQKGGQRVKELIEEGKQAEKDEGNR